MIPGRCRTFCWPQRFNEWVAGAFSVGRTGDLSPPVVFYVFIDLVDFKMIELQFDITSVEVGRGRVL